MGDHRSMLANMGDHRPMLANMGDHRPMLANMGDRQIGKSQIFFLRNVFERYIDSEEEVRKLGYGQFN